MKARYFIELDGETNQVIELVRFVKTEDGLWAEEYTRGKWIENSSKFYYDRDPPLYFEEINEQKAQETIQKYGNFL